MRLIDADKLHYSRIRIAHSDGTISGYNAVVMSAEIKDAHTVDAVPVVRCKDCIHLEILNGSTYYARCRWHGRLFESFGRADTRTWFCADGERRTE